MNVITFHSKEKNKFVVAGFPASTFYEPVVERRFSVKSFTLPTSTDTSRMSVKIPEAPEICLDPNEIEIPVEQEMSSQILAKPKLQIEICAKPNPVELGPVLPENSQIVNEQSKPKSGMKLEVNFNIQKPPPNIPQVNL